MATTGYERLSAQDGSYVMFEARGDHVHVTAIAVFDAAPQASGGTVPDIDTLRRYIASRLHLIPRYRQRLARTPIQRHPIWVDYARFDVRYHVRHAALPRPGDDAQLKELAGRIASEPLDPSRPLWEMCFVEGLEGERCALVVKVHHSLVDGVSGVGALIALLNTTSDPTFARAPRWKPRPVPGVLGFIVDGAARGVQAPLSVLRAASDAARHPLRASSSLIENATATWETLSGGLRQPADTPLNQPIGRQRRIDWRSFDLLDVKEAAKRMDGSVNDVILAVVAGAVRRFLRRRRVRLAGLDFRVVVPVDTRDGVTDLEAANRVSAWFLSLPIAERDPLRRFARIRAQTRRFKKSNAALGVDLFMQFADWAGSTRLPFWGVRLAALLRPYNLIATNVHGPQIPLYLLGLPLREMIAVLPLFERQGLAVAALSYLGKVHIGVNSDWDLVPDLAVFSEALGDSFAELQQRATGLS